MNTKTPKPVSIRIDPETRAALDALIERTGLKEAQLFRMAVKRLEQLERMSQPKARRAPK